MKRLGMIVALLSACAGTTLDTADTGGEGDAAEDSPAELAAGELPEERPAEVADPPVVAEPVQLPSELECVSGASQLPGEMHPSVWRATLFIDAEPHVTLRRGPRFESHDGVWSAEPAPEERVEMLAVGGSLHFTGDGETQVVVDLADGGLFFFGEIELDGGSDELVCWDRTELFGSAWSGQPRAPLARYDAALGGCVDDDGAPARNLLPIEFVFEARNAECADLRGVALNGGDFAYPDISLDLRGADLAGATLQFANLSGSFEGARLGALEMGYARATGSIDASTEVPALGCEVVDSPWAGMSMTCVR